MRWLAFLLFVALACVSLKYAHLCQDVKYINDELEAHRNRLTGTLSALKLAEVRVSEDFNTVWIPCECNECQGDGKVEGQHCTYCKDGVTTWTNGKEIKCPLCLGTTKRIGVCPHCNGGGKLWLEKRVKAGE